MKYLIALIALTLGMKGDAQNSITLEGIWKDSLFIPESVPGFNFLNDGRHYTRLEDEIIKKYDITTGAYVDDIFNANDVSGQLGFNGDIEDYHFSADESKILIESKKEKIYRRSYTANYHVYSFDTKEFQALFEYGSVMNATFSPDGTKVAYVYDNNLYYYNLTDGVTLPISEDGVKNEVINGITDWVYEEEFSFVKAFWWSPDSKRIAYLRFDEREVPEFMMTIHNNESYPEYQKFKYPKVGEKNAEVSAHLYDMGSESSIELNVGDLNDMYIPRVKWTQNPKEVCIYKMNRHQNHLQLLVVNEDNKSRVLLDEKNKYYIDITDDLTFLKDGKHFIWISEKEGFNHIYKYDMNGQEVVSLTKGNYDVTKFYGVDQKNGKVFYQSAQVSPMKRHIYSVDLYGNGIQQISKQSGWNDAKFSTTFDYLILDHSSVYQATDYTVHDQRGKVIRIIEDNVEFNEHLIDYNLSEVEFINFNPSEDVNLNGYIMKPPNFDPDIKYPLLMFQYSGPGSQKVVDRWGGQMSMWFQMLTQQGYIIACVDPRGTGARGEEFKKMTYLQLGKYETEDQIASAQFFGSLPYIDAERIGIFGWSYGGYMSSLCILKGADVFSSAIAVAPVTNWKWYDSVYTERYMRTRDENESGYEDNSPVNFVDSLKGNYLLVHGGADDNVHLQNSMEMASALIDANKQYDTYIYPNRNHRINGGVTSLHLYRAMTNFLEENLKNKKRKEELKP